MMHVTRTRRFSDRGFTLVEMIVVTFLLLVAMLGLLAVFDASARINKSETGVADAQGAVRYGIYQMTKAIRMAGAGGLFVTQAVLNHEDPQATGISIAGGSHSYNNVLANTSITDSTGTPVLVRPGTDMIEIRGVIFSPLLGFDQQTGCSAGCVTSSDTVTVLPTAGDLDIGQLVNDDPAQRPQFAAIDAYTSSVSSAANSMYVIVADGNTDLHVGCSDPNPQGVQRWPQPLYTIGTLTSKTTLSTVATPRVFGTADFAAAKNLELDEELPSINAAGFVLNPIVKPRRIGILDDIIFFIAMLPTCGGVPGPGCDPNGLHPYLAQAIRRGNRFEVTPLADDVEDLQIAYGVDSNDDYRITRTDLPPYNDPLNKDPNFSTAPGQDEWIPNAQGETLSQFTDVNFQSQTPFVDGHPGVPPAVHCPRLHAVMLSLLAKSRDPDPTYKGPAATGYQLMDVPLSSGVPITAVTGGQYRRRVQTLRINLRNYAFQG